MCLPLFCGKSRSKPLIKFIPGPNRTGEKRFRLSGPAPGRPKKGDQDYRDECERVEVERRFSLAKRKCGMGLVTAKLRETAAHVIAMSVLLLNLRKIQRAILRLLTSPFIQTALIDCQLIRNSSSAKKHLQTGSRKYCNPVITVLKGISGSPNVFRKYLYLICISASSANAMMRSKLSFS